MHLYTKIKDGECAIWGTPIDYFLPFLFYHVLRCLHKDIRRIYRLHVEIGKLQWCYNEGDVVSNHRILDCLLFSGADQRKHQSSASPVFVSGMKWWPTDSPHKWPVTRKIFSFDDVSMTCDVRPPVSNATTSAYFDYLTLIDFLCVLRMAKPLQHVSKCLFIVNKPQRTNLSEICVKLHQFPFKKMNLLTSSYRLQKWQPYCLGLNVMWKMCCPQCYLIWILHFDLNRSWVCPLGKTRGVMYQI